MIAKGITVEDIKNLAEKKLAVNVPDYHAATSTRNLVTYVRKAYPLQDNLDYATSTTQLEDGSYEITIKVVNKFQDLV